MEDPGDNLKGDTITATISGNVNGQAAVGKGIRQVQSVATPRPELSETDQAALSRLFEDLKAQVRQAAPPEKAGAALERADELEEAIRTERPDLTTVEYVRNWFLHNLPGLAGTVTGVLVNPIIGKLVQAAGDGLAAEFRKRLGF